MAGNDTTNGVPARVLRGPAGRPRSLTREVQALILELLKAGNFLDTACLAAGTTRHCFYHWRRRWMAGDPDAQEYGEFFNNIKKAIAVGEVTLVAKVTRAGPNWQAAAWMLERRHYRRWGKKDVVVVKGARKKDLSDLSDEELDDIKKRFGRPRRG